MPCRTRFSYVTAGFFALHKVAVACFPDGLFEAIDIIYVDQIVDNQYSEKKFPEFICIFRKSCIFALASR